MGGAAAGGSGGAAAPASAVSTAAVFLGGLAFSPGSSLAPFGGDSCLAASATEKSWCGGFWSVALRLPFARPLLAEGGLRGGGMERASDREVV